MPIPALTPGILPGSRPSERYFFGFTLTKLVFVYARQYSIVKDLDRLQRPVFTKRTHFSRLIPTDR